MGYRDELGAAHAKIEVLEEQLRALREEKEREEEAKRPRTEPPPIPPDALPLRLAPLPESPAPTGPRSETEAAAGLEALERIETLREEPAPARARDRRRAKARSRCTRRPCRSSSASLAHGSV